MSATIFISAPSGLSISLSHFLFFSTSTTSLNRFYQDYFYLFGTDLVIDLDLEERVVDLDLEERVVDLDLEERVVMRSRRRKTPADHFSSIADPILPSIKTTIDLCRLASVPVSFTRHSHKSPSDYGMLGEWWSNDLIIDGTPEANLMPEIGQRPGEEVVEKNTYSLEL